MVNEDKQADKSVEESNIDHINNVINNSESEKVSKSTEIADIHTIEEESASSKADMESADPVYNPAEPKATRTHKDSTEHNTAKNSPKKDSHTVSASIAKHHDKKNASKPIAEPLKAAVVHKKTVKPVHHATIISKPIIVKKHQDKKVQKSIISKPVKDMSKGGKISIKKPLRGDKMANHKEHKKKPKFSKNTLLWVGIGILAAVLVIALVLILSPKWLGNDSNNQTVKSVAATVNGEPIYLQDVVKAYNDLNPLIKSSYSVESMLNRTIDELLLYQQAKSEGIIVTNDEIQAEIDSIKQENNFNDTQLQDALARQGMTLDDVKKLIEKNIMIRKLLNATILQNITVTQGQIEEYYNANKEKFQTPAKVTVQHILIQVTPNVTENQSKAKIEQIKNELTSTNFCDLVTKYSDDLGSKNTCGTYTFGKGDFNNPDFENPSFDLKINETAIIKTVFGYHLIKKLDAIPARTLNLSEVSNTIGQTLRDQAAQKNFESFIEQLKAKADIKNYLEKTDTNKTAVTSEQQPAESNTLDAFAKCISAKGAVFYGAYWCPHCNNQKELFGTSLQYINYVECAVEGQPQVQTKACTDAGISGYPTWIIGGKSYPGEQTIASLAKLTGCQAP